MTDTTGEAEPPPGHPPHPPAGIMGYTNALSYQPGDTVGLHVSATGTRWQGELVRLLSLAVPNVGVPRRETPVAGVDLIDAPARAQATAPGSHVTVPGVDSDAHAGGLTVSAIVMPTTPGEGRQGLLNQWTSAESAGWSLSVGSDGCLVAQVATTGGGVVSAHLDQPCVAGCWYQVTLSVGARAGETVRLSVEPTGTFEANRVATGRGEPATTTVALPADVRWAPEAPIRWACSGVDERGAPVECYDGRIENPILVASHDAGDDRAALAVDARLVAHWDLAAGIGRDGTAAPARIDDRGPHGRTGTAVNHPQRGVTGHCWNGDVFDFRFAPDHYAAVHFHRDDMTDCGWDRSAELELPADLVSGVYAVHCHSDDGGLDDRIPVIVRPLDDTATADVLVVLSTNSYLAYGNDHVLVDSPRTEVWDQRVPALDARELFRDAHRELGPSLYETHPDGHGVCHSSWRRPLLTMRERRWVATGPVWQFHSDMQLIDWFDRTGRRVDVVCDLDVHRGGVDVLNRYKLVVTGTHPEYPTREMLEAYETYVGDGGRLIYPGGNGMYWVTAYDPTDDHVIEIRRWGGTQAWQAAPGEYHLSFSGTRGGIWRVNGRPPQKTFGVGFVASGREGASTGYRRVSDDPAVAWVFDGVDDVDFGAYGALGGGASGSEIDAVDPLLGTPAEAVVLATSVGHLDDMMEARENFNLTSRILGGRRSPRVRSDLTLVPRENGGAVFSAGSIAFAGALCHDDYDNDVARLFANVVDRFVSGRPVLDDVPPPWS